jgi:hypothetical protein
MNYKQDERYGTSLMQAGMFSTDDQGSAVAIDQAFVTSPEKNGGNGGGR